MKYLIEIEVPDTKEQLFLRQAHAGEVKEIAGELIYLAITGLDREIPKEDGRRRSRCKNREGRIVGQLWETSTPLKAGGWGK